MRKSTTKNALLMSALSLFLCFAMLTGTTFAWFTDTVESGVNQIVAGNLDVELTHKSKNVAEETVAGKTNLFSDIDAKKWEPNAMAMETFTVKNLGNLALKYELSLNVSEVSVGNDGTTSFATALKVAVVNGTVADRAAAEAISESEWISFENFSKVGDLMPTENGVTDADTWTVVIWWKPSDNDNNFNSANEIFAKFGVKLFATQASHESDSFGPDYDDVAWVIANADAKVSSAAELSTALQEGGLIALSADIEGDITLDNVAENTILNFAGNTITGTVTVAEGQSITINGQGGIAATRNAPAVKVGKNTDVTLAGGTYTSEDSAINIANRTEAPVTLTIEEGTVITAPTIIWLDSSNNYSGANVVINGGEFNSTYTKGDARPIKVHGGNVTINGGTFTIDNPTGKNCYFVDISSTYNTANDGTNKYVMGNVEINGGTFKSNVPYTRAVYAGISKGHTLGTVEINGGYFEFTADNSYLVDVPANVIVNDCTYIGVKSANVFNISSTNPADQTIVVNGGNYTVRTSPAGCFNYSYADRVILKGGTINSNKKLTDSLADGYKVVDNGNGTWSVVVE